MGVEAEGSSASLAGHSGVGWKETGGRWRRQASGWRKGRQIGDTSGGRCPRLMWGGKRKGHTMDEQMPDISVLRRKSDMERRPLTPNNSQVHLRPETVCRINRQSNLL